MRARIALIVALGSLAAPSFAADESFFQEAAQVSLAEVALGQIAATRGSKESVKAYGRQMVTEHQSAQLKLKAAAAKSGVALPTDLSEDAKATQKELEGLSGGAFDLAYVESQSKAHTRTIAMLEKEIASGTDPAAKAWASEALPSMKRHAETVGSLDQMPGEHHLEHAVGTPGPAAAPAAGGTAPPR